MCVACVLVNISFCFYLFIFFKSNNHLSLYTRQESSDSSNTTIEDEDVRGENTHQHLASDVHN